METTAIPQSPSPEPTRGLSLGARTAAIFARPTQAWGGLERRGQWWFPLLLSVLVTVAGTALVFQRALLPDNIAQIERMAESGQIPPEQAEASVQGMGTPLQMAISVAVVPLGVLFVTLLLALIPWMGAGFMLGRRFRFRDAWVVTCWAGLVTLPAQVLTFALAWLNETLAGVHIGFGALLPVADAPSKLMTGLGSFLDQAIGPFAIWHFVVLALGAAALSGAPRKAVLFTLGGLWLVLWGVLALLGGVLSPGA